MAVDAVDAHRSGSYKQQNKAHKHGRHRSKGAIDAANKGRVSLKLQSRGAIREQRRADKRHRAKQIRANKRHEAIMAKRSLGGVAVPPFLVALIPLCSSGNQNTALDVIRECDEEAIVTESLSKCVHVCLPRFKQRFSFICPHPGDIHAVLDAVKVADTLVFLLSPEEGIDADGEVLLSILLASGLPTTVCVIQGFESVPVKKRADLKKYVGKVLEKWIPKDKLLALDTKQDALLLLRQIGSQKRRRISLQSNRAHLLAEAVAFEHDPNNSSEGTLKVSGYIRGQPLDVNGLVHIPGWGDFQMSQLDGPTDPHPLIIKRVRQSSSLAETEVEEVEVLQKSEPSLQEELVSENVPDPMEGEQTWPTEEEMQEAEMAAAATKLVTKRVPKGTSAYQAAWIIDSDEEEVEDSDEEDDDDDDANEVEMADVEVPEATEDESDKSSDHEEYETITITEGGDIEKYDDKVDPDEEREALEKFKEERTDQLYPDEVDTPTDVPARVRFQKFRGLKSFRTSPWDPKENLPSDYARIFQFESFERTRKRVLKRDREGVEVGSYVTIHISCVPTHLYNSRNSEAPLVVFGLLAHECKMSVLNLVLKRVPSDDEPIKSKERLVFHVGFRRFGNGAIFSQHTNGVKHKFERFLHHDVATVATMYAPIIYPPSSALVFKEQKDGSQTFVASGCVLSTNPDRIVAKRIVLSGHPFKINRRSVVVRYMFFNREDIKWFEPVELRTKYGRRGHIKEPLGTHGHMKCVFDGQLKSQDTILMQLYKRVFPHWTYDPCVLTPTQIATSSLSEANSDTDMKS